MAIDVLNRCVTTGITNTAAFLGAGIHLTDLAVRGWVRNSDGIWITTAVVYYGAMLENEKGWIGVKTPDVADLAKIVAIGSSVFTALFAMSRNGQQRKPGENKLEDIPAPSYARQFSLAFTNAAAITLYVAQRLQLNVTPVQAFVATAVPYTLTTLALNAYFKTDTTSGA